MQRHIAKSWSIVGLKLLDLKVKSFGIFFDVVLRESERSNICTRCEIHLKGCKSFQRYLREDFMIACKRSDEISRPSVPLNHLQ